MPLFLKSGTHTVAGDVRSPPHLLLSLLLCCCCVAGVVCLWWFRWWWWWCCCRVCVRTKHCLAHSKRGCCCCCSHINSHNQVRGHRTGSSHSGTEEYPREKHTQPKVVHAYITADAVCCRRCVCESLLWVMVTCTADRYHNRYCCCAAGVVLVLCWCGVPVVVSMVVVLLLSPLCEDEALSRTQ